MTIEITVLEDGDVFGTIKGGEVNAWRVVDGFPEVINLSDLAPGDYQLELSNRG